MNCKLEKNIIFSILLVVGIASIPVAHADIEFSFKFGELGTGDEELDNPTDVIVKSNGKNIYVVDNNNNRINVFDDDGDHDFEYGTFCNTASIEDCNDNADGADEDGDGQFNNPISIALDVFGKFFVTDTNNERIQVFDDDGEFQFKLGSSNSGDDEYLGEAKGIVIHEFSREIYVSDIERDSISVFNSAGSFLFKFDEFNGNDDFKNPTNMIIDNSNDILYVTDTGNDRIVIFELVTGTTCPSGTEKVVDGVCFVEEFGSTGSDEGEFDDPTGLAFDEDNDLLFVADTDNDRIQVFEIVDGITCPSGTEEIVDGVCFVEEFGSAGTGNGEFDSPMGIAIDQTNDLLFVADTDNDRIQAFDLDSGPAILLPNSPKNPDASPISPSSVILSWDEPELDEEVPEISGYKIEYRKGSESYQVITEDTKRKVTSFIHQSLEENELYSYKIYSINSEGTSTSSQIVSTKPTHTITPAGLIATAISPSQIKLSWFPPSDTFGQIIGGYEIKREIIPSVYDSVGNTNAGTRTFIVSNLSTDKTYTYVVTAEIGFGATGESNPASATPREDSTDTSEEPITSTAVEVTVSTPPIKLKASVESSTSINLTWSEPVDNGNLEITGYKIEVKKDGGSFSTLVSDTNDAERSYKHTGLVTDSKYTYRVSAINVAGTSEPSNESSATPKITGLEISPLGKLTIDEEKYLSFTVKLTNSAIKDPVFSLKNAPSGSKIISNTGLFTWTPTSSEGGKTYTFDVEVRKDGMFDSQSISITVNDSVKDSEPVKGPEPITEPEPEELGIASFVDETKDPQTYVDRYNNEASYKKWFDDNYSEYDSIYQAVGLKEPTEEPKVEKPKESEPEKKYGYCGPGTKLIDGVCTIVQKPVQKPWWHFW